MREYVKPTAEIVELRAEESLATCRGRFCGPNPFISALLSWLGWCNPCKRSWGSSS